MGEKIGQFFPPLAQDVGEADLTGMDQAKVTEYVADRVDEVFTKRSSELEAQAQAAGRPPNSLGRSANYIALVTMDNAWSNHLQTLESLKEAVLMRKYEGRDPVAEYQNDAFMLFQGLEDTMRFNAVYSLWQSLASAGQPAIQTA